MWPFSLETVGMDNYANFSNKHSIYLTNGGMTLVAPNRRIQQHNLAYHLAILFDQIGSGDWNAVLFPEPEPLETEFGKAGTVICFESCFPRATSHVVEKGASFLFVTSPDKFIDITWLIGSNAVFRSVEQGIYSAATFNHPTGAIIVDPYGRIMEDRAPEPEIVVGKISFTDERTFYSKYGDVFGWSVVLIGIGLMAYNFYLKRKSPFEYCKNCRAKIKKDAKVCGRCKKKAMEKRPLWKRILLHEYYEVKGE